MISLANRFVSRSTRSARMAEICRATMYTATTSSAAETRTSADSMRGEFARSLAPHRYTSRRMGSYCDFSAGHPFHGPYHDHEYGFPVTDDDRLFERLVLEINQAGLSWLTILKKREHFRKAFDDFSIAR